MGKSIMGKSIMRKRKSSFKRIAAALLFGIVISAGVFADGTAALAASKEKIYLDRTSMTMAPGTIRTLTLKGISSKEKPKVQWSSSQSQIATVNGSGSVTARQKGTAKITASYKKKKYACKVKVAYGTHTTIDGMRYRDISGGLGHTGRWFQREVDGAVCYYTNADGSAFYFKISGSRYVNLWFAANVKAAMPVFAYSVDGGAMNRQMADNGRIDLGGTGTHIVRVMIDGMSEYENRWQNEAGIGIRGILPESDTGIVTAVRPVNAVIAFYGDSITQGVRALNMELSPAGTSASNSYAWYCAKQLDLVPYISGFGGSGIFQVGSFNNCIATIENFSAFRRAEDFNADVIVVEHGTNDIYTHGTMYVNEYRRVLEALHQRHPNAYIMAMIPFTQIHADEIRTAAAPYSRWCTIVETGAWRIAYTDGLHPNVAGAKVVGKKLAKIIAAKRKVSLK